MDLSGEYAVANAAYLAQSGEGWEAGISGGAESSISDRQSGSVESWDAGGV